MVKNNSIWIGNDPSSTENTAEYNVALGITALSKITTGDNNTAIGSNALINNTTGNDNVAIGYNTLSNSSTANYNIAIGTDSSKNLTTGQYSISIGNNSLGYDVAGSLETMRSYTSGNSTTGYTNAWQTITPDSGFENYNIKEIDLYFYNGSGTMDLKIEIYDSSITTSSNPNTKFSGLNPIATSVNSSVSATSNWPPSATTFVFDTKVSQTGTLYLWVKNNSNNSNNISIVKESSSSGLTDGGAGNNYGRLRHVVRGFTTGTTTGDYNVALGYKSLNNISSGSNNIGINNLSGTTLTTGSDNICIGYNADVSAKDSNNQIIIGKDATGHGNNIVVLGNSSCTAWHPSTDGQVNLGSSSYRFNIAYVNNITGSAATLTTARNIGGVSFNGSADIDLPGVNTAGNQNTTGSAATLTTARNIGGVSFDGSADIDLSLSSLTDANITNSNLIIGLTQNDINSLTGDYNTLIGTERNNTITSGERNTLIGYRSGWDITSGVSNVFIGDECGTNVSTGSNNICIGSGSNTNRRWYKSNCNWTRYIMSC